MFKFIHIAFVMLLMAACSQPQSGNRVLPYYNDERFTPEWVEANDINKQHQIGSFALTNQHGITISNQTVSGKIYVVSFFFTSCPGICKDLTKNIRNVQKAFRNDSSVWLLSHSVTPESDSVPVLKAYADRFGMIPGKWHLLTGNRDEVYSLARESYFADEDLGKPQTKDDFLHTENVLLIDKQNHIRGVYKGTSMESINQLIADINLLQQEG